MARSEPSSDPLAIGFVISAKAALQIGFLSPDNHAIDDHCGEQRQQGPGRAGKASATVSPTRVIPRYIGLRVRRYGPAATRKLAPRQGSGLVLLRKNSPSAEAMSPRPANPMIIAAARAGPLTIGPPSVSKPTLTNAASIIGGGTKTRGLSSPVTDVRPPRLVRSPVRSRPAG